VLKNAKNLHSFAGKYFEFVGNLIFLAGICKQFIKLFFLLDKDLFIVKNFIIIN